MSLLFPNSSVVQTPTVRQNIPSIQPMAQNPMAATNNQQQILQLWSLLKNSDNPQEIFNQAMMSNPQLKKLNDAISALGDPKTAFYTLAQKQGVDPNSVLNLLK